MLASYLMRGRAQAVLVTSVTALLSLIFFPLSYLSSGAIGLVVMQRGIRSGFEVMFGTLLVTTIFTMVVFGSPEMGPMFTITLWIPTLILAAHLAASGSLAFNLVYASLAAVMVVIAFYLFTGDPVAWWQGVLGPLI
ncbi:MAG: hypothetical protein HQL48_07750, partial [Gammaproteobacteria bacterium]|nr:hypothetical protein [Gammaproteobacteria bacterium]